MLTKSKCVEMTDQELARAERAFRIEIPRAQGLLAEIRREIKRRRNVQKQRSNHAD